jgi:hypothetical protein
LKLIEWRNRFINEEIGTLAVEFAGIETRRWIRETEIGSEGDVVCWKENPNFERERERES